MLHRVCTGQTLFYAEEQAYEKLTFEEKKLLYTYVCTYCQIRYGFDYYVQPNKNAGQYVKRGHFDDESECA